MDNDIAKIKFYPSTNYNPSNKIEEVLVVGATTDWVSIHMEKDYFVAADGCTIVIEDDRAYKYARALQKGSRVDIFLNDKPNFSGYIFNLTLEYDDHIHRLTIECKDLLEYMAQGCILPNFGLPGKGSLTNFHIPTTATLQQSLDLIVGAFTYFLKAGNQIQNTPLAIPSDIQITVDPNPTVNPSTGKSSRSLGSLTLASGFAAGVRVSGKKLKRFTKSVNESLKRLNTPSKGETYLHFIQRLLKLSGGYPKMAPGTNNIIIVQAPTYEWSGGTAFNITHKLNPQNNENNVKSAKLTFKLDKIPSVVIIEGNSLSEDYFYLKDEKAIAVNEMTGYRLISQQDFQTNNLAAAILPQVQFTVAELVNTSKGQAGAGSSYAILPFNKQLYAQRYNLAVDIDTTVCMPLYDVSHDAHDSDQLAFAAAQTLAHKIDEYVEFTYRMKGWSQDGIVFQPNMLVNVIEEALSPGNPMKLTMWIKKVNYVKSRDSGTFCDVTVTLPFTHNFELTQETGAPNAGNGVQVPILNTSGALDLTPGQNSTFTPSIGPGINSSPNTVY